jgi:hypothetical protein
MFAQTGKTKAQAIPYDWEKGIFVESTAGEGKWYVVMLRNDQTDYDAKYNGPFNSQGKTTDGLTNINVMVVNPLDESATIDVIAYIGDNETSRHFTLAKGGFKAMTFGAGMFVQMGIDRVYLYLVMDVTITKEEAEAMDAVNVNVTAVESENVVSFVPVAFDWTNWPNKTAGTTIPANKETWVEFDFGTQGGELDEGDYTYKFYVEKANATPITINGGISYDCPATSIQEQSQELKSASTAKVLDAAKLAILPKKVYVRIKAPQALTIYAEQVGIPAPDPEAPVLFEKKDAKEVVLNEVNSLNAGQLAYKVGYNTLKADENYYRQIEVTNHEDHEITIVGKATKTFVDGKAYSAVSKSVTIPAGQTYFKKIDKTMQSAVGSAEKDTIWAVGPAANVTFKLTQQPNDPEFCQGATEFVWNQWNKQNGGYKWYSVNIHDAKDKKADIVLTMETVNENEEANITVDLASVCELGAPMQSYSGKSKSRTKTLSYSLFKDNANDEMFVRVRTDKPIKVKAEFLSAVIYNPDVYGTDHAGWSADPVVNKAARVEKDLTINGTIEALGVTLADENVNITIENGGKLIVGKEGIKGSQNVNQIIIEDGGILLIKDATSNNKPFVTAKKQLHFGATVDGARRAEKHEFIALPIDNREELVGLWYAGWDYTTGWVLDGFKKSFTGYDVSAKAGDSNFGDYMASFKGQLANNKNQSLAMPGHGWHAFGNSWLDAMDVDKILAHVGNAEEALHVYVATPQTIAGTSYGMENDEKLYLPLTSAIASATGMTKIAAMQGFFLYTESATTATLKFNELDAFSSAAPAPKRVANNRNMAAAVVRGGNQSDFVYMIEGNDASAHKMMSNGLAIYAEDGLAQVANENLIGTKLTIKTNEATEYTLNFAWLNGETLYLMDLETEEVIAMTADNTYTFTATPNTTAERFQVIGRKLPTDIENADAIKGANKFIENGKVVIIKNGVKYNVLGAKL